MQCVISNNSIADCVLFSWRRSHTMSEIETITEKESFVETGMLAPPAARIPIEVRIVVSDPFEAYRRVREHDTDGFYLETTGGQTGWGYFGIEPVERLQVSKNAASRAAGSPSIETIDSLLTREQLVRGNCDVPYPCGAFGWLSYDIARELEDLPATTISDGSPQLQLGVFDRVAAWEEPHDGDVQIRVTACPIIGESPAAAYEEGREAAMTLAETALHGNRHVPSPTSANGQATFESECGEAAFTDRVRSIKQYIQDGDTFQANVSHRLVASAAVHPVETFDAVRQKIGRAHV